MTPEPIVFVVDDDADARDSVQMLVKSIGLRSTGFASAEEFLTHYPPEQPGCLVLDLRMDGMNGLELQEELNRRRIGIPTIITTGHADVPSTVQAMQSGAVTLLQKPCPVDKLLGLIRDAIQQDADLRQRQQRITDIERRLTTLTPQERRVMELVVAGEMNKTIVSKLDISLRTVERDRARVFSKMGVDSVARLVEMVCAVRESGQNEAPSTA